jgi:uncharacterized membrane protein YphA (DoxX/SURF4 family)
MRIAVLIARILLGLLFTVFGLNGFLHFIPQPPPPPGLAADFFRVVFASGYLMLPFALQLVGGVLLLANRYVPLALALLAPVIVNILMFHVLMSPGTIAPGLLAAVLWCFVAYRVRAAFAPLVAPGGVA